MARGKRGTRGRGRGKAREADTSDDHVAESVPAGDDEFEVDENGEEDDGEMDDSILEEQEEVKAENTEADKMEEKKLTEDVQQLEETPMETQEASKDFKEETTLIERPAEMEKEASAEKTEEEETAEDKEEKTEEAAEDKEEKMTTSDEPKKEGGSKKKKKKERTKPYELEKYWKAVKTNPSDFTGWTYLLQYVEQEDYMPFYREAFDAFFEHYPYCYGYWKKYADAERKKGTIEKCWEVHV